MGEIAIFGSLSTKLKVVASFILKAAGLKDVKLFKTEEEALKCLKED